jgi:hypothetical protein
MKVTSIILISILLFCTKVLFGQIDKVVRNELTEFLNNYDIDIVIDSSLSRNIESMRKKHMSTIHSFNNQDLMKNRIYDYRYKHIRIFTRGYKIEKDLSKVLKNCNELTEVVKSSEFNRIGYSYNEELNLVDIVFVKRIITVDEIVTMKTYNFRYYDNKPEPDTKEEFYNIIRGNAQEDGEFFSIYKDSLRVIDFKHVGTKQIQSHGGNFEIKIPVSVSQDKIYLLNSKLDTVALIEAVLLQ